MMGWLLFRAPTLGAALSYLRAPPGFGAPAPTPFTVAWYLTPEFLLAAAAGVVGSTRFGEHVWRRRVEKATVAGGARPAWMSSAALTADAIVCAALLLVSILQIAAGTYDPFIYFRF
jgi:alginate O-acetyltransferase complex protein AlgI